MPWEPLNHPHIKLSGKTVVITGGDQDLGKETVRDLYGRGARVIMGVSTVSEGEAVRSEIESAVGETGGKIEVPHMDLLSLASVRSFAEHMNSTVEKIDLLILNAIKKACPRSETEDGFESNLAMNHLGHFLLTMLLLDKVKAAAPSRIVVLSSKAHDMGAKIHFDNLQLKTGYSEWKAHSQSKLANVMFASELGRRLEGTGVTTYAVHPDITTIAAVLRAQHTLYCALEPSLADKTGCYYEKHKAKKPSRRARKKTDIQRLWQISEELVGLSSN